MATQVDNQVVSMKFDNTEFEQKTSRTMATLDKLKEKLIFNGGAKGIDEAQKSVNNFDPTPMNTRIEGISGKFLAMSAVAVTAISRITNAAITAGTNIAKSLTIQPVSAGFREYEMGLKSVQTILANTQASGATLEDVKKALDELNTYSDKTIYNFGEMTKNIGTFTAAGVDLKTATAAIKGIANLAALSGSDSEQASRAMYQLSQALSAGRVTLQDWNSVVNAGMGGTVFQRALAETAVKMGTLDEKALKLSGKMKNVTINGESFRNSIQARPGKESWLTSKVLTTTLKHFTGDMTDAQLAAEGFSKAQIKALQKQAKTATDAATKVKTFTQLMDTLKESAGSGWAKTWQLILGDFGQAKEMFTKINDVLSAIINDSSDARNKVLSQWQKLGGRDSMISAAANAFEALRRVLRPVMEALREVFPPMTGQRLYDLTVKMEAFSEKLKINGSTMDDLKRTARGIFSVFSIGKQIVEAIVSGIFELGGAAASGGGGILSLTANIGDFLTSIDRALKRGGWLKSFFKGLGKVLSIPLGLLGDLASSVGSIFDKMDVGKSDAMANSFGRVNDRLEGLKKFGDGAGGVWDRVIDSFTSAWEAIAPAADRIGDKLSGFGDQIAKAMGTDTFDGLIDLLNTALLGGIVVIIKRFFDDMGSFSVDLGGGGVFESLSGSLDQLTDTLGAMQTNLQAKTLITLSTAIAMLAGSLVALSMIDSKKLRSALTAVGLGMTQLMVGMGVMLKLGGLGGFYKMPILASGLVLLAGAILILSAAVRNLSGLSWDELKKGLGGVAALLGVISLAVIPLSKNSAGMLSAGLGILAISVGIRILASAVGIFSSMSWDELKKGLGSVAALLGTLAGAMAIFPRDIGKTALSILAISGAMAILAGAMSIFATMSIGGLAKGLLGVGGALAAIGLGIMLVPPNTALVAAGLLVMAVALEALAAVILTMGLMSGDQLARGITALAGSLTVLAIATSLMSGSVLGAVAISVVAAGLMALAPALVLMGSMSWEAIGKGLVALAGALAVLGIASALMGGSVPVLIGLGVAFTLMGLGLALAGAGLMGVATAMIIFAKAGGAFLDASKKVLAFFPSLLKSFANALVGFIVELAKNSGAIIAAGAKLMIKMLEGIVKIMPKLEKAIGSILGTLVRIIVRYSPRMADAGWKILLSFLNAMRNHIYEAQKVSSEIITEFLRGLGDRMGSVINAGFTFIIKFVNGLATAIDKNSKKMGRAGGRLAVAIIRGIVLGFGAANEEINGLMADVGKGALRSFARVLGISSPSRAFRYLASFAPQGIIQGFLGGKKDVEKASEDVADGALDGMRRALSASTWIFDPEMDMTPVIAPVLDLTGVESEAKKINGIFGDGRVDASLSYIRAEQLKADADATQARRVEETSGDTILNFNQVNNSPEALDDVEIYRQTKRQIAMAKEELTNR